jgi:aspartate/methionine/tyrosine aminotransferase
VLGHAQTAGAEPRPFHAHGASLRKSSVNRLPDLPTPSAAQPSPGVQHDTTICNSAPSEILALIALRARAAVLARGRAIIDANLPLLDRFFAEWAEHFAWARPRAGSVAFPRLRADLPIERFAAELIEAEGVLLLPGSVYDHPGNHFRLGFGRADLPEALAGLERFASTRLRG